MKGIPNGWLKYQAIGGCVDGTKMIPFKVPLTEKICSKVSDDKWFTPSILLQKHPGLKVVIDLTDTTRYYDPQEFQKEGVAHVKIQLRGGGALPPPRKLRLFFQTIDRFMKEYADDPDALVGVHCTHGLNRTGYFICHYMVNRLKMAPDDAIARFEAARGHTMHRFNYLEEIRKSKDKIVDAEEETVRKSSTEYSSPLVDTMDDYIDDRSRRNTKNRSKKTIDNWRTPGDSSGCRDFKAFNRHHHSGKTPTKYHFDDKSRHSREKRDGNTNILPYEREQSRASSSRNWRDRP